MGDAKIVLWEGSSKADLRGFPEGVREDVGHALWLVQQGEDPPDGRSMSSIGPGACEIRADDGDAYRVIYIAKFEEAIYVLHAFQKKSKSGIATPKNELDRARKRYTSLVQRRAEKARTKKGGKQHGTRKTR